MISGRRVLAAASLAVAVVGGSACSTFDQGHAAATVDGESIDERDLGAVIDALTTDQPTTVDTATGTVSADIGRNVLGALIRAHANVGYLHEQGIEISADERSAATDTAPEFYARLPEGVRALLVESDAALQARGRAIAQDAVREYDADPAATGLLCLRAIQFTSQEAAQAVIDQVAGGAAFADLAADPAVNPDGANGGVITSSTGSPCFTLDELQEDSPAVQAAMALGAGEVSDPIEASQGIWILLQARPGAEVADALGVQLSQSRFDQYLTGLDVSVDPRYGRWDPTTRDVVDL